MATDSVGRVIDGRYRLVSRLAQGGMGVTYRAWDLRAGCPVVLKMPRRPVDDVDGTKAAQLASRFVREIEAMRALAHDHIVPIRDAGDDDGLPFVSMRFLPGGSLADHRKKDASGTFEPMPAGALHFWLPAIAEALDFIHSRGVVHRDVKPANIFFDGFWWAFLGDFGIAKVFDTSAGLEKGETLTGTQFAVGTPEYMPPEMLMPKAKLDGRADQYALAVSVYEMLAGVRPFTGESANIVVEHATMPVPPLDRKRLRLPASLTAAVERGLAKKPEERFGSCMKFARAALADVTPQPNIPGVVRLLCPECHRILRAPQSAGGRGGTCPTCKTAVEIAADFSALWRAEEAGIMATEPSVESEAVAFVPAGSSDAEVRVDALRPSSTSVPLSPETDSLRRGQPGAMLRLLAVACVVAAVTLLSTGLAARIAHVRWSRFDAEALAAVNAERKEMKARLATSGVLVNSIGMELKLIPAGTFMMGSANGFSDQQPVHQVTITRPYYVGIYEVTNRQWKQVMGEVPSPWKDEDLPIVSVSWEEVVAFCKALSALPAERRAGRVYRLPTEAEWEYACRAGTTTAYSFGDDESLLGDFAWFNDNSWSQTHPVGQKQPNGWGLYDMHGNVWEWCSDWSGDYGAVAATDPQGPAQGSRRVLRGGCWNSTAGYCPSAHRHLYDPSIPSVFHGFRLALSPSGAVVAGGE